MDKEQKRKKAEEMLVDFYGEGDSRAYDTDIIYLMLTFEEECRKETLEHLKRTAEYFSDHSCQSNLYSQICIMIDKLKQP